MKLNISNLKQVFDKVQKKPKRNVVHTIGYSKFSPKEMARKTRKFVDDNVDKEKVKDVARKTRDVVVKTKDIITNPENQEKIRGIANSIRSSMGTKRNRK